MSDDETFGQLLHGTARAWRQKLDQRLKPMGLSQAKWRTLMHLSIAPDALTQAEIAARLGVEEPTVVALLHRLEREAWVTRTNSPHATADKLRHELLAEITECDLKTCMRVLARVRDRAEESDSRRSATRQRLARVFAEPNGQTKRGHSIRRKTARRRAREASNET